MVTLPTVYEPFINAPSGMIFGGTHNGIQLDYEVTNLIVTSTEVSFKCGSSEIKFPNNSKNKPALDFIQGLYSGIDVETRTVNIRGLKQVHGSNQTHFTNATEVYVPDCGIKFKYVSSDSVNITFANGTQWLFNLSYDCNVQALDKITKICPYVGS
jgi:hypothetical protein